MNPLVQPITRCYSQTRRRCCHVVAQWLLVSSKKKREWWKTTNTIPHENKEINTVKLMRGIVLPVTTRQLVMKATAWGYSGSVLNELNDTSNLLEYIVYHLYECIFNREIRFKLLEIHSYKECINWTSGISSLHFIHHTFLLLLYIPFLHFFDLFKCIILTLFRLYGKSLYCKHTYSYRNCILRLYKYFWEHISKQT